MELIALFFLFGIPAGYVIESYSYSLQKQGEWGTLDKLLFVFWNVCGFAMFWVSYKYVTTVGTDNFNSTEQFEFLTASVFTLVVFAADGIFLGSYLCAQKRYLNNVPVPAHLLKTKEDIKREREIFEAKKQAEFERMEREAGLREVPEPEPEPEPEPFDHEAELEDILKNRK